MTCGYRDEGFMARTLREAKFQNTPAHKAYQADIKAAWQKLSKELKALDKDFKPIERKYKRAVEKAWNVYRNSEINAVVKLRKAKGEQWP